MIGKWDACILSIHSMTGDTIMRECFLAVCPCLQVIRERVLLFLLPTRR